LDGWGDAEDLATVDIRALVVNLGVIEVQNRHIQRILGRHVGAGVTGKDKVGGLAVLLGVRGEAEALAWDEVGAAVVDRTLVDGGELIGGDVLGLRDEIAVITFLDGV